MRGSLVRRRTAVPIMVTLMLVLTACQDTVGATNAGPSPQEPSVTSAAPESAGIEVTPKDQAADVAPASRVSVRSQGVRLESVTVIRDDGKKIEGRFAAARNSWSAATPLDFGTLYRVVAIGRDSAGQEHTARSALTTASPKQRIHTAVLPLSGERVGVGLPIQVTFNGPVPDRAAAERNLKVVSTPAVVGSWRWISDTKVRFRPKTYWRPGTEMTLTVGLRGVALGNRVYGDEDRDVSFTIGPSVVSVVDGNGFG
ncbi:MAG: hypothetical protein HOV83_26715 [Catenulispora sp.]|nr:hypothetical protein [Catenulispora sp.]